MPCPTCGHTMQNVGTGERHFWCPRCGTIKTESVPAGTPHVEAPKLVERCRTLQSQVKADVATYGAGAEMLLKWLRMAGIAESIHKSDDRPS